MFRVREERHDPRPAERVLPGRSSRGCATRSRATSRAASTREGSRPEDRPGRRPVRELRRRRAIRDAFGFSAEDVVVPRGFAHMGALGAAAAASERAGARHRRSRRTGRRGAGRARLPSWPPLTTENVVFLRDRVQPPPKPGGRPEVFLGIDIGSVSTNFAVTDWEGNLLKEIYVGTQGRPVQVVTDGLKELRDEFGDTISIRGVGTTGSGRELIGELVAPTRCRTRSRPTRPAPPSSAAAISTRRSTRSSRSAGRTPSSSDSRTAS